MPDVAPVTTTVFPVMSWMGDQCANRRRVSMPTRLKLPATEASSTASTGRASQLMAAR